MPNSLTTIIAVFSLILVSKTNFWSQNEVVPLNFEYHYSFEKELYKNHLVDDSIPQKKKGQTSKEYKKQIQYVNFHSQVKPIIQRDINTFFPKDSLYLKSLYNLSFPIGFGKTKLVEKARISPLIGLSWQDNNAISYSAGASMELFLHEKFTLNGFYRYAHIPNWEFLDSNVHIGQSINGLGIQKDSGVYTLHHFEAYASYSPNEYFNFLAGNGKHFWGDGYRSLLLSDNASAYPFFRINSTFWNVRYTNLWSMHKDYQYKNYTETRTKFQVAHQISWNIIKNLNLSIFETIIWQAKDTLNNRNFEPNYLNPIIFFRPVEYSIGSSDNALLGASLKYVYKEKWIAYSQLILDEFFLKEIRAQNGWWANKYGIQVGVKTYDLFGVKNLSILAEYNMVRPFTYAHVTSQQNYAHNDQSLAHPLGSNFHEGIFLIRYQFENLYVHSKTIYAEKGEDFANSPISYGGNMFRSYVTRSSEYNNKIVQGNGKYVFQQEFRVSYAISNAQNLRLFLNYGFRSQRFNTTTTVNHLIQFGLSSNLWNTYSDL